MIIETILFLAFVVALGVFIVKVDEWRYDALYGPHISNAASRQNEDAFSQDVRVKQPRRHGA